MSKGRDLGMTECGNTMSYRSRLSILMRIVGMLLGLPGLLVSTEVILLSLPFGYAMRMRGAVLQFGGSLVVFVM